MTTSRLIVCPRCQHSGTMPKTVPTIAKLKCQACGARMLLRHAIRGENGKPCRWRDPSQRSSSVAKSEAARAVLARVSPIPEGGDDIPDLTC